jgi:hypothetical protein
MFANPPAEFYGRSGAAAGRREFTAPLHAVQARWLVPEVIMFHLNVMFANRVRHYSVVLAGAAGWEVKLEEDRTIRWCETCADWHRVERMLDRVQREVSELVDRGWTVEPDPVNR